MIGTGAQWAFDRGSAGPGAFAVGTVRSAAFADAERPLDTIAAETADDLAEAFPEARSATLQRARVYKERRATMRATPDTQRLRPSQRTHVGGAVFGGGRAPTPGPPPPPRRGPARAPGPREGPVT